MTESPVAVESDAPHALEGEELAAVAEADAAVRQGTLSGFENPEAALAVAAPVDEANAASPVAGATTARRAPRAKRAVAPAVAEAVTPGVGEVQDPAAAAFVAEPSFAADHAERVEPTGFASEAAQAATEPDALTQRLDALQGALAEQRRMAVASSRQLKWVLAAAAAAVLASAGFGIAQSVRLDSLANESRADEARLEQFILKQQSTLDDLSQRVAAQSAAAAAAAAAAAETPAAPSARVSARAAPAKAPPAPARHAASHSTRAAHAKSAQKATH
ncbi:hypothetical protein M3I54_16025 [Paraburkholderia sp. CNPSo 3274]|uniref:hypothetical protein n=1 Tax=Paraburkholderia sp. CNPSo 3274 TaxID=2940932 RepID=UPI0020B8BBE9|nr:hypothetical protein [Paraburkholderia sp. CNPSo 3274]MCP3708479.1 hypothetical protein [Paraburkholderia sp. CNPSo 3274]